GCKSRSDRAPSPTTMPNTGVPSMDGLSAALGLQQTGGYATLLSPNSIHIFELYPLRGHRSGKAGALPGGKVWARSRLRPVRDCPPLGRAAGGRPGPLHGVAERRAGDESALQAEADD